MSDHYSEGWIEIEHKGKFYRTSQSLGFKGAILNHVMVCTSRGFWKVTSSHGVTGQEVLRLAAEKIATR